MFFVFGPSGQMYRGGPEQLGQVSPVRRVQRPQALRTRGPDVSERAPELPAQDAAPAAPVNLRAQVGRERLRADGAGAAAGAPAADPRAGRHDVRLPLGAA